MLVEIVHAPLHVEPRGDRRERRAQVGDADLGVELDALEEQPGRGIGVLVRLDDVAARLRDERADRGDDPGSVRALEEKDGSQRHRSLVGRSPFHVRNPESFRIMTLGQKRVSSSSSSRRRARSTSTQATPLLSA